MITNIFLLIGLISMSISAIIIGFWTEEHQQRAHYYTQPREKWTINTTNGIYMAIIGLASFAIAGFVHVL